MKEKLAKETEMCVQFLKERYALDISVYDNSFLEKTIHNRLVVTSCKTTNDYLEYLGNVPDEPTCLINQLSNSYSEFFRNQLTFSILEQTIIPKLFNDSATNRSHEIRIWSAGCASGQEPYSLAILFDDFKNNHPINTNYRIFATDNSQKKLDSAVKGIFDFKSVKNTKLEFVEKYFRRNGDNFMLDVNLMKQVDFSFYDLLEKDSNSPPSGIYGDFDLIVCCNVLLYYQPEIQQKILQKFYRSLKTYGFLITGEAETSFVNSHAYFKQYTISAPVFIKN